MRVFKKGTGRRRALNRRELCGELDTVTRQLAASRDDRDRLAERLLTAETEVARAQDARLAAERQAKAANTRVAELEQTLVDLRVTIEAQHEDTTETMPIPTLGDGPGQPDTPTIELAAGSLPSLPEWARHKGFTYSRANGFQRLSEPGPSVPVEQVNAQGS